MSQLRQAIRPSTSAFSPVWIVLVVILLQALLLSAFLYLARQNQTELAFAQLALLLTYSAVVIGIAIVLAVVRHRWMQSENRVRQRLLDVIDAIPDPSAVRDAKGKYIMWNKAAEAYHGVKAEHVLGKTPYELFPKDVARSILELDTECGQSRSTVVRRLVLPPLYGKGPRVANIRVAPVRSSVASEVRGVVTILHDITETEREASALKHLSTQLKMALDTSGFGSWIWDLKTNGVTYSVQYQALLRYAGKDFAHEFQFLSRIHPGDAQQVIAAAKRSIKDNTAFDQVYRLRGFDEAYRYFHASGEPVTDEHGHRHFAGLLCPLDRMAD